jgi:hypothetical protein
MFSIAWDALRVTLREETSRPALFENDDLLP